MTGDGSRSFLGGRQETERRDRVAPGLGVACAGGVMDIGVGRELCLSSPAVPDAVPEEELGVPCVAAPDDDEAAAEDEPEDEGDADVESDDSPELLNFTFWKVSGEKRSEERPAPETDASEEDEEECGIEPEMRSDGSLLLAP